MSRRKLHKGITWFANDNHDIELFMEQDCLFTHNFPIWQHNFQYTSFTDGELLLMNENLKRRKLCYGDMLERKASGWSDESLKYVKISDENSMLNYFSVVGSSSGKYGIINSIPKQYNKV